MHLLHLPPNDHAQRRTTFDACAAATGWTSPLDPVVDAQELIHTVYLRVAEWCLDNPPHVGNIPAPDGLPGAHEFPELLWLLPPTEN